MQFQIKKYGFGLLMLCCFSCVNHKREEVNPEINCNTVLPETVSFNNHVLPLFGKNCSLSGCHSGNSPAGNLNLEPAFAYSKLSKRGSGYIDTLKPEKSVLYSALVSVSNPMPPTGNLAKCDIELIRKWMLQKAKNN